MIGTARTENAPPVTIAVPYSSSHIPGRAGNSAGLSHGIGKKPANKNRWRETQYELSPRSGEQRRIRPPSFGGGRGCRNRYGHKYFRKPHRQPCARCRLTCSQPCRGQRRHAHGYSAPTGNGSELGGALHGFADVFQVIGSTRVDGDGFGATGADWMGERHGRDDRVAGNLCQVLCTTKYNGFLYPYFALRYRPCSAFQRIINTSRNICTLSRSMLTLVAGECDQRTGTSMVESS